MYNLALNKERTTQATIPIINWLKISKSQNYFFLKLHCMPQKTNEIFDKLLS